MGLGLSIKAFLKAWNDPAKAEQFVADKPALPSSGAGDLSHLQLLSLLQQAGRLIDFLKEDISSFNDAQVGAAVRNIHASCGKSLEELVAIRPVFEQAEGTEVRVPKEYNPYTIKIVGKVKGEPPFTGILVHKGWKAHKKSLPSTLGKQSTEVICPAEIQIK